MPKGGDMSEADTRPERVTAGLLVIGDEILSGRTHDRNIAHIAAHLTRIGIVLEEVRVVPDKTERIIEALDALRRRYDYVFTTGGTGPTHDDITADSVAAAFGVPLTVNPRAVELLEARYGKGKLTGDRLRMARIPEGAELIENAVSAAPGFMLGNVIVMAGIPRVMQAMLTAVTPRLKTGRPILSRALRVEGLESDVAAGLRDLQEKFPDVSLGSYPFYRPEGFGTHLVFRGTDPERLDAVEKALRSMLDDLGMPYRPGDREPDPTDAPQSHETRSPGNEETSRS